MGKSQKPLEIIVHPSIQHWEEWEKLKTQGYTIVGPTSVIVTMDKADIVMGPTCWRMDEEHREYLDLAIAEARKVRYPKVDKEAKDEE